MLLSKTRAYKILWFAIFTLWQLQHIERRRTKNFGREQRQTTPTSQNLNNLKGEREKSVCSSHTIGTLASMSVHARATLPSFQQPATCRLGPRMWKEKDWKEATRLLFGLLPALTWFTPQGRETPLKTTLSWTTARSLRRLVPYSPIAKRLPWATAPPAAGTGLLTAALLSLTQPKWGRLASSYHLK